MCFLVAVSGLIFCSGDRLARRDLPRTADHIFRSKEGSSPFRHYHRGGSRCAVRTLRELDPPVEPPPPRPFTANSSAHVRAAALPIPDAWNRVSALAGLGRRGRGHTDLLLICIARIQDILIVPEAQQIVPEGVSRRRTREARIFAVPAWGRGGCPASSLGRSNL
jgi:hypothetical protein